MGEDTQKTMPVHRTLGTNAQGIKMFFREDQNIDGIEHRWRFVGAKERMVDESLKDHECQRGGC